jgi:drug/metabolite transporter (DMT)-like permease
MAAMSDVCDAPGAGEQRPTTWNPATVGIVLCALSALFYTVANICRRQLAALDADPTWVSCNQEAVTVILLGPWLAWQTLRGRKVMPPKHAFWAIVLVGLTLQVVGNQSVQWAMGVVGLSVTVPVIFAVMLISSALMGRVLLGEHPSPRSWAALGLVLLAIVLLTLGAERVRDVPVGTPPATSGRVALAVVAAAAGGMTFAMLTVTIRSTVTGVTPVTSLMFLITLMGPLSLGPISVARLGVDGLLATPPEQAGWMLIAGLANFCGFMSITRGLQLTPVVNANVLTASQIAMAALAGMILFREPFTPWLASGIALTISGILLINRARMPGKEG